MADRPGQQLEARWQQKLEARPQDQNQVISLIGGAVLNFQAMGRLDARDIHFWLHESPPDAAGRSSFQPDRLLAEGNVVGDSPQFSIKVQRLEVWFTSAAARRAGGPWLPECAVAGSRRRPTCHRPGRPCLAASSDGSARSAGHRRRLAVVPLGTGQVRRRPAAGRPTWKSADACCRPACSCRTSSMAI